MNGSFLDLLEVWRWCPFNTPNNILLKLPISYRVFIYISCLYLVQRVLASSWKGKCTQITIALIQSFTLILQMAKFVHRNVRKAKKRILSLMDWYGMWIPRNAGVWLVWEERKNGLDSISVTLVSSFIIQIHSLLTHFFIRINFIRINLAQIPKN